MKKFIQNIVLLLLSSLVFLFLMEIVSRIFFKAKYTHVVNSGGEVVSMQVDAGNPANGLEPFFKGRMVSNEFNITICLDSLGFRKREQSNLKTHTDTLKIALLGDSFMFGWGVESSQSYGTHLANGLNAILPQIVIVYPLAIPGTGQITQLSLLRRIRCYRPDIVIVGMYITDHVASGNDLIENLNEYYKLNSTPASTLTTDITKTDKLRQVRRWLKTNSNLFRFVEMRLSAIILAKFSNSINFESDPKVMERAWSLTDSVLVEMQKETKFINAQFVIQYVPNMLDVVQENNATYIRLEQICAKNKIQLAPNPVNLLSSSNSEQAINKIYFVSDGHWTPRAHKIVGESAVTYLSELYNRY